MKPITKLYLKIFLVTGIPYGLAMTGFDWASGKELSLWKFLFMTVFFGAFMSFSLVAFHKRRLRKNGIQSLGDESLGVDQKRSVTSKLNKSDLLAKLKQDPVLGKMKISETASGILISTKVTWKSWGEEIKVTVQEIGDGQFEYQILSSPKAKTTLIDYGKNLENVNLIANAINGIP